MSSHGKIRSIDMRLIDDLFEMGGGYVLNFSNKTFAEFFDEELGINIDDSRYDVEGTSKAKRLRFFLKTSDSQVRIQTLLALWEYREVDRRRNRTEETIQNAEEEFYSLIERLGGKRPAEKKRASASQATTEIAPSLSSELKSKLMEVSQLEPQARGYAFEKFLKDLFDANGLAARASFRLVGEQIDGSFELAAETYLLEAKWTNPQIGATDLRSFNGKVEEKAAWSRGLFVSHSGFTPDGLAAFGRGKRVVCMDGFDLYEMLDKNLSFADVMAKKIRHAAESGNPFVRVRDLYV
jgi:restriction endonuclease Mrr